LTCPSRSRSSCAGTLIIADALPAQVGHAHAVADLGGHLMVTIKRNRPTLLHQQRTLPLGAGAGRGTAPVPAPSAPAERLGLEPVSFPSQHDGFLGGEYGMIGDPDAFATTLQQTLTANA
jgi:hypothetical protein